MVHNIQYTILYANTHCRLKLLHKGRYIKNNCIQRCPSLSEGSERTVRYWAIFLFRNNLIAAVNYSFKSDIGCAHRAMMTTFGHGHLLFKF